MSATQIKNVAITAATGALGSVVFKKLVASGEFKVRVLSSSGSTSSFPAGTDVVKVDYSSLESLTKALEGQDAVVSAAGNEGIPGQKVLVDAAIAAGVKRFLPSEFGSDLANPKARALPVFHFKVQVAEYLEAKAAELKDKFTYTRVYNNAFLDWGLAAGFLLDLRAAKPRVWGSGDLPFAATTLSSVGDAVVGVLKNPEQTANRAVYIRNVVLTQNKLIALVNELNIPGKEAWKTEKPDSAEIADIVGKAEAELRAGAAPGPGNMVPFLFKALFSPDHNQGKWGEDNELLGVKEIGDEEIKAIIKGVLAK
ncbi:uncharacterized protein B0I36DRAFT_371789 [Microdochium trichocladiopsis]|uniref:NmrA-like domain-containing protein n=1 Tax=Microdochium trichocladiopsis TaxID=1682393 RepID=A0A9P9BRQ2_9PEZI|nr:uncharacterized protein B0I36DRAFT_371789 [Microdochium trichocladiopsis]KAH7037090.1 hypothetical protein B0I36DRAFT_371789 [Microdochium trichocladiopsis]